MGMAEEHGALLNAISADTQGIVTSFILIVNYLDGDGDNSVNIHEMDGQTYSTGLGLLEWAQVAKRLELEDLIRESKR